MRRFHKEPTLRMLSRKVLLSVTALLVLDVPAPAALFQPGCCQGPTGGCIDVQIEVECIPPLANTFFPGSTCDGTTGLCGVAAVCGNGSVEAGEQCDDGNTVGGDGCSAVCGIEGAAVPQSGLRADVSADFEGLQSGPSCIAGALDPNPADAACVDALPGHAEAETSAGYGPYFEAEAHARARASPGHWGA